MSLAGSASRSGPVLARLVSLLRNIAAVNSAIVRVFAFLRRDSAAAGSAAGDLRASAAIPTSPGDVAVAAAQSNPKLEREQLIRRRWAETGVKMWNAMLHGAGQASLNIQGSVDLLPPAPGETGRRYDKLEYALVDGLIMCEGVAIDPPKGHQTLPPQNAARPDFMLL
jgi:hypothetical protein